MDEQRLTVVEEVDPRDVGDLSERLYEFNAAATGCHDGRELAIFLRDDAGEIQGGLYGWTWAGRLHIQYLWLHESLRGQGLGSRLLASAEATGRERGCSFATVDTYTFQAPAFYEARGYAVYFAEPEHPPGHRHLLLRKGLVDGDAGEATPRP